jgi:putative CocE/NonD family hydrolase
MISAYDAAGDGWEAGRHAEAEFAQSKGDNFHLIVGWCDYFVNDTISLYEQKVKAGDKPYLTVYNGDHFGFLPLKAFKDVTTWMNSKLKGDDSKLRKKHVALQLHPSGEWFYYDKWPLNTEPKTMYLSKNSDGIFSGGLLEGKSQTQDIFTYTYNPEDPTPSFAGISLFHSGNFDNLPFLLDRQNIQKDSLTFVSSPTPNDYIIGGRPRVQLVVSSSLDYTDFYVKLLDYSSEKNESINISEGFFRVSPTNQPSKNADGSFVVDIELSPIFHRYSSKHQVMLQVASGAHPHYSRNPGTGEHITTATKFVPAEQKIFAYLSSLSLPVLKA